MRERERNYGIEEDVRREIEGRTEFEKDIEDLLISKIAEIEKNDGAVSALSQTDWIVMYLLTAVSLIGCAIAFMNV